MYTLGSRLKLFSVGRYFAKLCGKNGLKRQLSDELNSCCSNTSEIVIGQIEFLITQKKKGIANTEPSNPPQTKQDVHTGDRQAEEACPSKVSPGGFA